MAWVWRLNRFIKLKENPAKTSDTLQIRTENYLNLCLSENNTWNSIKVQQDKTEETASKTSSEITIHYEQCESKVYWGQQTLSRSCGQTATTKPSKVNIKLIIRGPTCFPSLKYRCLTAGHLSLLIQNSLSRNSTGSLWNSRQPFTNSSEVGRLTSTPLLSLPSH